ncbi:tRNA (adenosine(37)-N6)-threonylcarbamoyltransferase complex ATPase subunit type 1 TsaE [Candidatus Curtissbacteria bacterium RBG_13_35_7]|uniref:tRNA threonylcarbamoyladenosine biosynthesis protein TsaE n=1 Tax=Candidatus Curtissbacteria bacterium RBG_13_35_7 TaxID=1797705 RepID=A0A1F5G5L1_9BACT|nr:MAG: tRNA (adenosine(37)-N6)-threonylcarbamoyltransferase complex ATPase subunit type 1 TsaE [Candidatus Curtissbacteria bacterium RBG_13_35_7]
MIISNSPQQTQKIAQNLAENLKAGDLVTLYGNLGAGKTVFIKGIAKGLGLRENIVSPTFVFLRSYSTLIDSQKITIHHLDLYRGDTKQDFKSLGLDELISDKSIVVIEWADKIKDKLPKKRIDVIIEYIDGQSRRITISRN